MFFRNWWDAGQKRYNAAMSGELELVRWMCAQQAAGQGVIRAGGDDLAVLQWAKEDLLLVGIDQILDGVHVDSQKHSARQIGRKAMNRNLSDCAAMACLPAAAVVSVALPRGSADSWAKELYSGLKEAADAFDCPIVGGDTASWKEKLALSVAILGRSAGVAPVLRSGAKPGDGIYVTGGLGGSILGRHLDFTPRIELARWLARQYPLSAMMDISDGLALDLRRLCRASGVGAVVEAKKVPIHADAQRLSATDGVEALFHALCDGEDHELLFTTAAAVDERSASRIGMICSGNNMELERAGSRGPLPAGGWEHGW